jgi:hypothetical protein
VRPNVINPDSVVLQQVEGHWQKLCGLILWKTVGRDKSVTVTLQDMQALADEFAPGIAVVLTHGHSDSLEFKLVDEAAARRLAAHDATMRGSA